MAVQVGELKKIAQKVLDISNVIDYRELRITYAQKTEGKWKVSFEYEHSGGFASSDIKKIGSFIADVRSGDIEGMWLDRSWK